MNMDTIVDTYTGKLQESGGTYILAGIATEDFGDCCAVVSPEMPRDVFVDMLASLYWMYVAAAGLTAGQTALLTEAVFDEACLFLYDDEEAGPETASSPAEKFGELSQEFFDELQLVLGENVEAVTGVVWNGRGGSDARCSVRTGTDISSADLASLIAAEVITMTARGTLSPEEARRTLQQAGEELEQWLR